MKSLLKVGNGYLPFLERTYRVAVKHPQILPAVFDFAEFQKDYQLAGDLADIAHQAALSWGIKLQNLPPDTL